MKKLFLVRGLPGSGKTTFAKMLAASIHAKHFEADNYFYNKDGEYVFVAELLPTAHKDCQIKAMVAMSNNLPVVVSNTFTTKKEMEPYIQLAHDFGYEVTTMVMENRHGSENIHSVPDIAMERMRDRFDVVL